MTSPTPIPLEIDRFCRQCSEGLADLTEDRARIALVRNELSGLLLHKAVFARMLRDMAEGGTYPDLRHATMFDNELLLYADGAHRFSLRMFLWDPGDYTPVHDHSAWGVIGPVSGKIEAVRYRRQDDGSREDYARLVEVERLTLLPGETGFTLPLDDGIHKIGNPTEETTVSLSLYGNPLPRGYIYGFDIAAHGAYRILAPKVKKKQLAARALRSFDEGR